MKKIILACILVVCSFGVASANDYEAAMKSFYKAHISSWSGSAVLVDAIRAQNVKTSSYHQDAIDQMDLDWRAQLGAGDSALVNSVVDNAAADFLRSRVAASDGTVTEIFIMDARGLNVAATDPTSDMWQGDEDKFNETFPKGPSALHLSEVEFDESTQKYQGQISFPVIDPTNGEIVGAMTVGVDAEALL